jgi:alpha-mannosidase
VACITFSGGAIGINKKTGQLERLDDGGTAFLKAPCALKAYNDVPFREPCWNFQADYWNHPKAIFDKPATVEVIESGPVRHVVRVTQPFGTGSRSIVDYSVVQGVEGVGVSIAIDYHETETLLKYEIPIALHASHSIAETCYATSKRRNKPEANRDVPRWEKWMHTFVAIEGDDGVAGLAVLNEGKYGFDTRGGNLGISIVHGPRFPETNIVAWARDERKKRKDAGLGEPPTHADQGMHLTRLWLLPYGSWRKGRVHQAAHGFNSPAQVLVLDGIKNARQVIGSRELSVKILRSYIHDAHPKAANWIRWVLCDKPSVEVSSIKPAEKLPPVLDALHGQRDAVVIRVVNDIDGANKATVHVDPRIAPAGSTVIETDLLERPLPRTAEPRFTTSAAADGYLALQLEFKPHEIRTFKIFKEK